MLMRKLVLFVFFVFSLVALTSADNRLRSETDSQILSRISDYKTWKQVNRVDGDIKTGASTFTIENSFAGGG